MNTIAATQAIIRAAVIGILAANPHLDADRISPVEYAFADGQDLRTGQDLFPGHFTMSRQTHTMSVRSKQPVFVSGPATAAPDSSHPLH